MLDITNRSYSIVDSIQHYEIKIIEETQKNQVSSELRILKNVTELTGISMEKASFGFISIFLFIDLIAVGLLIAALHTLKYRTIKTEENNEESISKITPDPIEPEPENTNEPEELVGEEPIIERKDTTKRRRGRPKGSKNKPKVKPQILDVVAPEFEERKITETGLTEETVKQIAKSIPNKKKN